MTNSYHFRVDPTAASADKQETPLEIVLGSSERLELLDLLSKFMEMPDNAKHIQLALLANSDWDADEDEAREFHKILNSLPVDLVGFLNKYSLTFGGTGEHHKARTRRTWNNPARCCANGQSGLCPGFAGIWVGFPVLTN